MSNIEVTLTRVRAFQNAIVGQLHIQTANFVWACQTLELPWKNNQPQVSCIPAGTYTCRRVNSPKFGDTFEVCGVPERSGILFHAGNYAPKDTRGCILLGIISDNDGNNAWLEASRAAMTTFRQMLEGIDSFKITIK